FIHVEEEVTGFYQKVRRDINAPWTQFYLSGKLLKGCHGSFIFMGNEVGDRKNGICQANQLLNTESISLVTFQRFNSLSKREKEILKLMAEGYQNKEIADRLSIAPFTVQTHRKNIKAKLEIKNMRELIRVSDLFNW
ncbi:MAG: LuxR family transcriptional regulator, partial [Pedobacter sp.]